jgi:hypothetical protein
LPRLRADPQLGRFWAHRGEDGVMREKQLIPNFKPFVTRCILIRVAEAAEADGRITGWSIRRVRSGRL